jgi:hypothetical protein
MQEGRGDIDDASLATALVDAGFGGGDDPPRIASEIVKAFWGELEAEILRSPEGVLLSHRAQMKEFEELKRDQRAGLDVVHVEVGQMRRDLAAIGTVV